MKSIVGLRNLSADSNHTLRVFGVLAANSVGVRRPSSSALVLQVGVSQVLTSLLSFSVKIPSPLSEPSTAGEPHATNSSH